MRRRLVSRRLAIPAVIAGSVLVGLGCGVLNPELLGTIGGNPAVTVTGVEGNIVIMLINQTDVTAQANVTVTKENGSVLALNIAAEAFNHSAVVQACDVDTIQVDEASYAGPNGAVVIPAAVSPFQVGLNLQCGGVVNVTLTGTAPNIFLAVQGF